MFAVLAICLFAVSVHCVPIQESEIEREWLAFRREFKPTPYNGGAAEEAMRRQVFESMYRFIVEHNAQADQGLHSYRVGVNEFSDLTDEEFRQQFLNYVPNPNRNLSLTAPVEVDVSGLAGDVNWVSKGAVSHIKNQGQCGSCFAFSATDAIEGAVFIATGKLVTLSPQQIVDCTGGDVCSTGGWPNKAIQLTIQEGGVEGEADYPYTARHGTCRFSRSLVRAKVSGVRDVAQGSESALQQAVNTVPTSVAIDASRPGFRSYKSGVYAEAGCSSSRLDHAVLAVGYSSEGGKDYWLVKNSWGTSWGQSGYIHMVRNQNNHCGIATDACYATGGSI